MLILICFLFGQVHAQEMGFLSPMAMDRRVISLEHESMSEIQEEKASLMTPLVKTTDSGDFALTARGQRMALEDRLRFPKAAVEMPKEFGSLDLGLAWKKEDPEGNKLIASASYGYAGTRLLTGESSPVLAAMLVVERNKSDHSWLYFLSYSNNRPLLNNIPIPGIGYAMNGEDYNAVFGLPFAFFNWRPRPWMLTATLSPFGAGVDGGYSVWGPVQAYANVAWLPKAYQNLVKGSDQRLIFDRKQAGAGARVMWGPRGSVSAGYVYNFDRRFLLGKSIRDDDAEAIDLGDSGGFQVKLKWSF
jgi:hypothetical protein